MSPVEEQLLLQKSSENLTVNVQRIMANER